MEVASISGVISNSTYCLILARCFIELTFYLFLHNVLDGYILPIEKYFGEGLDDLPISECKVRP